MAVVEWTNHQSGHPDRASCKLWDPLAAGRG
jgi:hypothetical protein